MHKKLLRSIDKKLDMLKKINKLSPIEKSRYENAEKELAHVDRLIPNVTHLKRIYKHQKSIHRIRIGNKKVAY